jgi:hypothetical protein
MQPVAEPCRFAPALIDKLHAAASTLLKAIDNALAGDSDFAAANLRCADALLRIAAEPTSKQNACALASTRSTLGGLTPSKVRQLTTIHRGQYRFAPMHHRSWQSRRTQPVSFQPRVCPTSWRTTSSVCDAASGSASSGHKAARYSALLQNIPSMCIRFILLGPIVAFQIAELCFQSDDLTK